MLKLQKNRFFLLILCVVVASFTMACEQGSDGDDDVKDIIVSMPVPQEGAEEIDRYEIELFDADSMETLDQFEAGPGESKAATIVNTGAPVLIRATALDENGFVLAEAESTNVIGFEHDGVLCDFTLNLNRDGDTPTLEISANCQVVEIMKKMVSFVRDHSKQIVKVTVYVVRNVMKDAIEDMKKIIEIWNENKE